MLTVYIFSLLIFFPLCTDKRCSPVPSARIGREQQCNFEFTRDTMETRSFVDSWNFPIRGREFLKSLRHDAKKTVDVFVLK